MNALGIGKPFITALVSFIYPNFGTPTASYKTSWISQLLFNIVATVCTIHIKLEFTPVEIDKSKCQNECGEKTEFCGSFRTVTINPDAYLWTLIGFLIACWVLNFLVIYYECCIEKKEPEKTGTIPNGLEEEKV